ncbi:G-protein coupled receptor 26-like [Denticeps clupeoides]|nr:G-protein coupled receptor 26-like [Denticeps clupeoides]
MQALETVAALSVAATIAVSLPSNVLVLTCFLYSAEIRRQVPGLFVLNLTCCNLLLTVANMPLTLAGIVTRGRPGGHAFCHVAGFLDTFLTANSMLSVAALSVDRWVAVVFPLSYHSRLRRRDAAAALGYAWIHSLAFPAVASCYAWIGYQPAYASCTLRGVRSRYAVYTLLLHGLTFLLSLLVLCATYLKVLKVARSHCRRIDVITMQTLVLLVDIHPSVRQRCLDEQRRRRQRATRKISTFIGTFVVCFTPYVVTRVVQVFVGGSISPHWGVLCKCLAYSKAACDPFVYSLLRHQYRKTCRDMMNRLLRRSSLNASGRRPVDRKTRDIQKNRPEKETMKIETKAEGTKDEERNEV